MQKITLGQTTWYSYFPERVHLNGKVTVRHGTVLEAINGDITVGNETVITQNCLIDGPTTIGKGCIIGPGTMIITHEHNIHILDMPIAKSPGPVKPVVIEDNCYIGGGCIILQGVTIHEGAVIGAGSVVTKDIPENVIAFGVPCSVIKKRGGKR